MKKTGSRFRSITLLVSTSFMLFTAGLLLCFLWQSKRLVDHVRETQILQVELQESISSEKKDNIFQTIQKNTQVKSVSFISKEDALKVIQENTGEVSSDLMDENPLFDAYDVHLKPEYYSSSNMASLKESWETIEGVVAVHYEPYHVKQLDITLDKMAISLAVITGILLLITIFTIHSTIRLAMYSQRLLLRSMQLVGATQGFILKPYILQSAGITFLSWIISCSALGIILYWIEVTAPDLNILQNPLPTIIIALMLLVSGTLLSMFFTWFAAKRFIKQPLDKLL